MADPDHVYAEVDMSKKGMPRELSESGSSHTEPNYYTLALENESINSKTNNYYSIALHSMGSQELPASTVSSGDYREIERFSQSASDVNVPGPIVGATSTANGSSKIKTFQEAGSSKRQTLKHSRCAVVVILVLAVMGIVVLFGCVIMMLLEINKLKSDIAMQRTSSESYGQMSAKLFMQQAMLDSNISEIKQQQVGTTIEIAEVRSNVQKIIMQQKHREMLLNDVIDVALSPLQNELSDLRENLTGYSNASEFYIGRLMNQLGQINSSFQAEFEYVQSELQLLSDYILQVTPSCAGLPQNFPSGYYWIKTTNGSAVRVYCDMSLTCGHISGGWMRIGELDMTNSSHQCPSGLSERTDSNIRSCEWNDEQTGCYAVQFSTHNILYSQVCGKVLGYQIGYPQGFNNRDINSSYVDGVSLTYGQNPREHIWTFGASRGANATDDCSCTRLNTFVMEHYFCDTGNTCMETESQDQFFSNPLWDGMNCIASHDCCHFNSPPWFYRSLHNATTDDIDMRICKEVNGNVAIQTIELYVQI